MAGKHCGKGGRIGESPDFLEQNAKRDQEKKTTQRTYGTALQMPQYFEASLRNWQCVTCKGLIFITELAAYSLLQAAYNFWYNFTFQVTSLKTYPVDGKSGNNCARLIWAVDFVECGLAL